MEKRLLVMNEKDNVGSLLEDSTSEDYCIYNGSPIDIIEEIKFGHKVSLKDISAGENIIKYGEIIGYALEDITKGQWIHNHNMGCRRGK